MINTTGNAPSFNDLLASVAERIRSSGDDPADYNVLQLMDDVVSRGGVVDQIDDGSWWLLLKNRTIEDETEVPCPEWCRYEHGHVFECETDDGLQVRYHALQLESPDGVDLSIVQEESRPKGDDSGFARGTPTIWLTVDDGDVDAEKARAIAASVTAAGDELDRVTGDQSWTEGVDQ